MKVLQSLESSEGEDILEPIFVRLQSLPPMGGSSSPSLPREVLEKPVQVKVQFKFGPNGWILSNVSPRPAQVKFSYNSSLLDLM